MQRTRLRPRDEWRRPLTAAHAAQGNARRPPRRTQESRSRAARERLLQAALDVLVERGYNGLTTKEVSLRAGFSNGALMHHYRTKADLVIAAGAHIYDRCIESGRKIASSTAAKKNPLGAFISDCLNVYLGWPFVAALEIMVAARTDQMINAEFDAIMRNYRKTMNEIWLSTFVRSGMSKEEASFLIMTTLYQIRGMGINSMWQKNVPYYKRMLREWEKLARFGAFKGGRSDIR